MAQTTRFPIPRQFREDLKDCSTDSEEEMVQCCQFPTKDRKGKDNSTIIVFEKVPYIQVGKEEVNNSNIPLPTGLNNTPKTAGHRQKDDRNLQNIESIPPHEPINLENFQPYHQSNKEIEVPVARTNYKFKSHLVTRYSEELEEENKQLKQLLNVKFKNNSPESYQLENKLCDKSLVPVRNANKVNRNKSGASNQYLPETYQTNMADDKLEFAATKISGSEAWLRMKKISANLERAKIKNKKDLEYLNQNENLSEQVVKNAHKSNNGTVDITVAKDSVFNKENDSYEDNTSDLISFSSEFSFSSGYRSSNLDDSIESEQYSLENNQEDAKKDISKEVVFYILRDIIDSVVFQSRITTVTSVKQLNFDVKENQNNLMKDNKKRKVSRGNSLQILVPENDSDHDHVDELQLLDDKERYLEQTKTNTRGIHCIKTTCKMKDNDKHTKMEEQDSVDSFVNQDSARLPDLESIGVKQPIKKDNCVKRNRFVFVGIDGRVLAESSKESSDDKDSFFKKVVAVDIDEDMFYYGHSKIHLSEEKSDMTDKLEHISETLERRKFEEEDSRPSNFLKSYKMNRNRTESASCETKCTGMIGKESSDEILDQNSSLLFVDRRGRVLAGSNRNSVDKIQCVKRVKSRLFSGSLPSVFSNDEIRLMLRKRNIMRMFQLGRS